MYIFTYVYIHQLNKYTHTYRTTHVYTHTPLYLCKLIKIVYMHAGHVYKLILMNTSMTCVHIFRTYRYIYPQICVH